MSKDSQNEWKNIAFRGMVSLIPLTQFADYVTTIAFISKLGTEAEGNLIVKGIIENSGTEGFAITKILVTSVAIACAYLTHCGRRRTTKNPESFTARLHDNLELGMLLTVNLSMGLVAIGNIAAIFPSQ